MGTFSHYWNIHDAAVSLLQTVRMGKREMMHFRNAPLEGALRTGRGRFAKNRHRFAFELSVDSSTSL